MTAAAHAGLRPVPDIKREQALLEHLDELGVPIFTTLGRGNPEYQYPPNWQTVTPATNWERIEAFTPGNALCAVGCDALAFVDVDPQNGGSVDEVRTLLDGLGVRIYYEDRTPGGGAHFGVAGHPDLPSVSGQNGLPGWPGVEIKSHGTHVYLPGTRRPKYDGAGYRIIADNLETLADGGDEDSAEALVAFVATQRATSYKASANETPATPWDGTPHTPQQTGWLRSLVTGVCADLASSPAGGGEHGGRNRHLNYAAWRLGKFVAGAGLDEQMVVAELEQAAIANGLMSDDGPRSVAATIASGLRSGKSTPAAVPEPKADPLDDVIARMHAQQQSPGADNVVTIAQEQPAAGTEQANQDSDNTQDQNSRLFEAGVEFELDRLRIREEARARFRREQAAVVTLPRRVSLTEFLAEPDPPIAYRIDKLHPLGGRCMLAAQKKAGKTTLVGNLIRSLADGGDFLGRFSVAPAGGHVALIDNELHETTLRRWLRDYDIVNTDGIDVHPLRGKVSTFNILDVDVRSRWAATLRATDTRFVILDCLRPFLDALGLNEHTEAGRFLVAFDELLDEAGVDEAIVVHHMGHSNERARGDSRIGDWADANWKIVRENDEDDASPRYFSAFGRDVDVHEGRLSFDKHTRNLRFAGTSRGDAKTEAGLMAVIEILIDTPDGLSINGIETAAADLADPPKRAALRGGLKRGIDAGLLAVEKGERGAKIHRLASSCTICGKPMSAGQAASHIGCIGGLS